METILIEFINTLDLSLKKMHKGIGGSTGLPDLTIHQFQYIDAVNKLGSPKITEIADHLKITKASVTNGVNKLVQMGYIVKTQSSDDERVFLVRLTKAGEVLIAVKYQALKEYGNYIQASLEPDEARQFKSTLTKLVKIFTDQQNLQI